MMSASRRLAAFSCGFCSNWSICPCASSVLSTQEPLASWAQPHVPWFVPCPLSQVMQAIPLFADRH